MLRALTALALVGSLLAAPALAQTVVLDLSTQFPNGWDYTLDGDPAWTHAGHDGTQLYFRTIGSTPSAVYYDAPGTEWSAATATGSFSVYAAMQVSEESGLEITDPTVGLATIVAATGSAEVWLEFLPDRIALGGNSPTGTTEHTMDTTDRLHVYELQVIGNQITVWVDGVQRLEAMSGAITTAPIFRFGHVHLENFGRSNWTRLAFGPAGAVPVANSSVSGLKSRFRPQGQPRNR